MLILDGFYDFVWKCKEYFLKIKLKMHSRRMSYRKSELKIQVPDLFLSVQNNSDPIISGLLLLL